MADITTPTGTPIAMATEHLDALSPGTRLAEFEIQGLLGVGGFGMVYRGYDHSLHRPVAIKEYMPTSLVGRDREMAVTVKSAADSASFQSGLRSFIAEARLLARFDHPSLVKVYRFWEANNTAYMAMPLYEGITLKEARRRMSGPPPQAWLQTVLWSVLAGLKVLHDSSTLHRDVSPDNIFLQDVGPPVLLDLGAARRAIMDISHKHTAVLKVNYAPIEQYADAKDMQEGPWTDLYAVAAVVHGCICNEPPLPSTFRAVRDRMPPFAQVAQTAKTHFSQAYSDSFVRAVSHALSIVPTERTSSVEVFAREMGLQAPTDLAHFDWRTALGDSVVLTEAGDDGAPITTESLTTQPASGFPDTVFQPSTYDHRKTVKAASQPEAESRSRPLRKSRLGHSVSAVWVGLLSVGVVLVLGWWFLRPMPSPSVMPVSQELLIESAREVTTSPSSQIAAPDAVLPSSSVISSLRASKPQVTDIPAGPARAPVLPKNTQAVPATATGEKSPAIKPSPKAEPKSVEDKPAQAKDPIANCAEASILTRTMCVYRECQKPEFYPLPVCVADRKHWDEKNKGRN